MVFFDGSCHSLYNVLNAFEPVSLVDWFCVFS